MLNLSITTKESKNKKFKSLQIDDLEVLNNGETEILSFSMKAITKMTEYFETLSEAVGIEKANTLIHTFLINKIQHGQDLSKHLIANNEQFSSFLTLSIHTIENHDKPVKPAKELKESTVKTKLDTSSKHIASALSKLSILLVPTGTELTKERIEAGVNNLKEKLSESIDWSNVIDQAYELASKTGLNEDGSIRLRKASVEPEEKVGV